MNTLINIFGPSAAGKSTTTELLQEHIPDLVLIDFDSIKRQIPDYHWKLHGQEGRDMTLKELAHVVATGAPIVLLYPVPKDASEHKKITSVADVYGYEVCNVEITAPRDVLMSAIGSVWRILIQLKRSGSSRPPMNLPQNYKSRTSVQRVRIPMIRHVKIPMKLSLIF